MRARCMPGCLAGGGAAAGPDAPRPGARRAFRGSHPNGLKESNHFQRGKEEKNAPPSRTGRQECALGCWEALRLDRPRQWPTSMSLLGSEDRGTAGGLDKQAPSAWGQRCWEPPRSLGFPSPCVPEKLPQSSRPGLSALGTGGHGSPSTRDASRRQPLWPNARGPVTPDTPRMKHQPVSCKGVRLQPGLGVQVSESPG